MKRSENFWLVGILAMLVMGCQSGNSIVAATGTVIGVEISQNQATQAPDAVLGYRRAEFAYVPTNKGRAQSTKTTEQDGHPTVTETEGMPNYKKGARDSANVLMELRYGGIFSLGSNSGIYQRLAVGDIAVAQPGASLMFARNTAGEIDENAKEAVVAAAQQQIETHQQGITQILGHVLDGSGNINTKTLSDAVDCAAPKSPNLFTPSMIAHLKSAPAQAELYRRLLEDVPEAIPYIQDCLK